jgi:alpha-ketoglutarate-dependent taurine dioxygenase
MFRTSRRCRESAIFRARPFTPTIPITPPAQGDDVVPGLVTELRRDTQYVNMHQAYDDLPAATKERIDGLKAVHVYLSK